MSVVVLEKQDKVAIIKINRPEAMNSLNDEVLKGIDAAVDQAAADPEVHVLIFTGEGKAFVAGADIAQMSTMNEKEGYEFGVLGSSVFRKIEKLDKPSIAAVNGFALGGGCELAMSCDMRIASEKAKFGQPEVGLGITPGYCGTQRLARIAGKAKACELILTGKHIKADEALAIGLVNKVVAPEALMDEALALAADIAKNAPLAVRYSNKAIKEGLEATMEEGIKIENDLFAKCFATEDQKEGMAAFLEKRKAEFKGK
ncbi:enoyl-CoA hydratase-related protein [Bacilliculturomica massiliensis]|uniref:enoyl-CoA hydratase-related protein n=1 Tax=Bacilliculturomica massiliensis TaxID=1917867 RepID=UPI001031F81D|nr:enoyl-CoA hydratase-related protein [Bacilliculturomica massiliensis]